MTNNYMVAKGASPPAYWMRFAQAWPDTDVNFQDITVEGGLIRAYELGNIDKPAIVIVNPPATPFLMVSRLATRLSEEFRVISWESRGSPYLENSSSDPMPCALTLANDLLVVADALGVECFHVIGSCAAMNLISLVPEDAENRILSLFLIAPVRISPAFVDNSQTDFTNMLIEIAADGEDALAGLHGRLRKLRGMSSLPAEDRTISDLRAVNLDTVEGMQRYAMLMDSLIKSADVNRSSNVETRFASLCARVFTTVLHCVDDDVISHKSSVDAFERSPNFSLVLAPEGGHIVHYKHAAWVADQVAAHINLSPARVTQ